MKDSGLPGDNRRSVRDEDLHMLKNTVRHLPGRSADAGDAPKKGNTAFRVLIVTAIALFVTGAVILCLSLAGNVFRSDPLKGRWTLDGVTEYEFNGKGKGTLDLPLNRYEFSYVAEEGELKIDFTDPYAEDHSYFYSLTDDELTLIDGDGTAIRFVRSDK